MHGRTSEAYPLLWRAPAIDEEAFGRKHAPAADDLTHLDDILAAGAKHEEAEAALSAGARHPRIASRRQECHARSPVEKIIASLEANGSVCKAEAVYEQLMTAQEKMSSADRIGLAAAVNNIGLLKETVGGLDEAERLYQPAGTEQ